ncbi:MAG: hypothetical protein H0U98_00850 [Alphaproteobacteria bacterium]|nr:hypothetical protein [Alphaproteobacteria bacterium]
MTRSSAERLPLLLFLVGAVAFIALLLLFAYAPDLRGDTSNGANVVSRSAIGFAGLQRLLDLSGIPTEIDRGVTARERKPSLTILTPDITTGKTDWHDYEEQSAVLVILPKWITVPMPLRSGWVVKAGAWPADDIAKMLAPITKLTLKQTQGDFRGLVPASDTRLKGLPRALPGHFQLLQYFPQGGEAVVFVEDPHSKRLKPDGVNFVVRVRDGDKPIYILSDPDLMNNQGLSDPVTAQTALTIIRALRRGNGPVRMDVMLNGMTRSPSLLKALFEPPFRGATICASLAAILMALHALSRFGAPLRESRPLMRGKQALASNTAELVRMMGRQAAMAPRYVQAMRNLALARLGARSRSAAEQEQLLDAMEKASHSDTQYGWLANAATQAKTGGDLIAIAARAWTWKGRITSEHP